MSSPLLRFLPWLLALVVIQSLESIRSCSWALRGASGGENLPCCSASHGEKEELGQEAAAWVLYSCSRAPQHRYAEEHASDSLSTERDSSAYSRALSPL